MKAITAFISRHPWLYIVFAFLVLITAWSALISVAIKFTPERIEVKR